MKSIGQIFRSNRQLMDEPEVQELIEYCRELEGQVMDRKIDDNYDKEHVLRSMLKDIRTGIDDTLNEDEESIRFNEIPRVDFKERNRHNDMIVEFGKKTGKKHNCHMTEGKKDLWNVTDKKLECYGSKN